MYDKMFNYHSGIIFPKFWIKIENQMIRSFTFIVFFIFCVTVNAHGSLSQAESIYVPSYKRATLLKATPADIISSLENTLKSKEIKNPSMLTGSAELGFLYKTGNTNSGDMKTGIDLRLEKGAWLSLLNVDFLFKKLILLTIMTVPTLKPLIKNGH